MKLVLAALVAVFFMSAAQAQDCFDFDKIISDVEAQGGEFVDALDVNGVDGDRLVFVSVNNGLWVWYTRDDCAVAAPTKLISLAEITAA